MRLACVTSGERRLPWHDAGPVSLAPGQTHRHGVGAPRGYGSRHTGMESLCPVGVSVLPAGS